MIETIPLLGSIGAEDAVSVQLSGTNLRQIAVPHHVGLLGEGSAGNFALAGGIEKTQFYFFSMLRVKRKIDALAVPRRAEWVGATGPHNRLIIWHLYWFP